MTPEDALLIALVAQSVALIVALFWNPKEGGKKK